MSPQGRIVTAAIVVLGLSTHLVFAQGLNCTDNRYPVDSDIIVTCGPSEISLTINACPVQFASFNPESLALNGQHNQSHCAGALVTSLDPPVMSFTFPLNDTRQNPCGNTIEIINSQGSGLFADYSNVQTVVISGFVDTPAIAESGIVSFSTNLNYNFSCHYPLQYFLNNVQLLTSSASVAVNTNNGSFISTLSMRLFLDENFTVPLENNGSTLPLKQKVYVQVIATNLTANFHVHLDQCFATPAPVITTIPSEKYSLLTGCNVENKTTIIQNGKSKTATFSFETFRFLAHSTQAKSTIYLHCMTRLCQPDQCVALQQICSTSKRRKRDVTYIQRATDTVTVSSGPIYTTDDAGVTSQLSGQSNLSGAKELEGTLTGLIVGLIIAALLGAALVFGVVILYKMYRLRASQNEKSLG
ncbi:zona pellucida-like domain-containing protein 1 [Bombina bombina]|uniref:zona pellucida-like domain-containing protein 1 n=1 Tax=Bombina bombina TaxID=8345 RepID=UPI00235A5AE2|nr:zona pellucida-like domain-containing protein 1 [Bombina bombina]